MMDAVYHNSRWVYAADAAGRVCASTISPYPPGIPLIYPGELFDDDTMDYILWGHEVSLNMMGIRLHDGHVQVRVMDDDGEAHS
jgi:arginine/lysine/ornithine decarboxylase